MTKINNDLAIKNNLNAEDIILISYLELINSEIGKDNQFSIGYSKIINDLPILFSSTERSNIAKLWFSLYLQGIKKTKTK